MVTPGFDVVLGWIRDANLLHFLALLVAVCVLNIQGALAKRSLVTSSFLLNQLSSATFSFLLRQEDNRTQKDADHSSEGDTDHELEESLKLLRRRIPNSTLEERRRFLVANKGDAAAASKGLSNYCQWRQTHDDIAHSLTFDRSGEEDLDDWNVSVKVALVARNECLCEVPRVARTFQVDGKEARCRNGHKIVHVRPGRMDERRVSLEAYALAMALYLDRKFDRNGNEPVTVMIDARGGNVQQGGRLTSKSTNR